MRRAAGPADLLGRVMHQLAEDPLEVGEGILAVTPDLFDEGVDYRAAPAGFLAADEHPVLHAKLGRADGVFGEVVVELDLPVEEARLKVRALARRIGEGFAEQASGRDIALRPEVDDEPAEPVIVPPRLKPSGFLAFQLAGPLLPQRRLDPVDAGDLVEDPCGEGIEVEMVAHHGGEAVEALSHVAGLQRDVDLEVAIEGEHGGGPQARWCRSSASSLIWPGPAARATAPPGKRTSRASPDWTSPILARRKAGASDRCLAGPGSEPRRRPRDPCGKGGILDVAPHGKGRRAEASGFEGVENLALVMRGVTGAAGAVALADRAGEGIGWCFHGSAPYRNRAAAG
jgi:hypothetical protein